MDMNQYLDIFIDETKEHLQNLNEQILVLEKEPENEATINEIFRAAHSLKGMAGTMGYKRMQRLTHDMENVFSEIRNGKMKASDDLVDVLFRGLDALESYLANIQSTADEGTEDNEDIISVLNEILKGATAKQEETPQQQPVQAAVATVVEGKYKQLELAEHERHVVAEAYNEGESVFGMTVYIQEACILKSARAFLVFKALEEQGTIIKSQPYVQDIEDEKFDFDFSLIFITKLSLEEVKARVLNVSEIKDVVIEAIEQPVEEPAKVKLEARKEWIELSTNFAMQTVHMYDVRKLGTALGKR